MNYPRRLNAIPFLLSTQRLLCLFCSLCLFCLLFPAWSFAQSQAGTPFRVPETGKKIKIDGNLDDSAWAEALKLELKYEVEPGENIDPPVKTEGFLIYGGDHLYVAFRAHDPNPSRIRARFTDRDNIWEDDYVGIVLDTFNDSRRTYNFYCNPFGIQAEKVINIQRREIPWDAIWNSAGKVTPGGYIVEMAIPFSSMRFQRDRQDQVWGIDLVRSYPRTLSHQIGLFPRNRDNNCYMCQANKIIGFKGAKPGKQIELDPTLSAVITQEREGFPGGEMKNKTRKMDPGISGRWRFTPNLALSAAINPDFSHVEADAAQLDINNQFAIYYPEKRPFFLEDANIFSSMYPIIFTRTLRDPNWGVKLTGKEGAHSVGFFSVHDNQTFLTFPGSQNSSTASLDMNSLSTAARYVHDVGKSSALGVLFTDREGEDYYNRVAGIDGDLKLSKRDQLNFHILGSWSRYPGDVASRYGQPDDAFDGHVYGVYYAHNTENYGAVLTYHDISPGFRADLGSMYQVGYRFALGGLRYTLRRNPGHWFTRLNTFISYQYEADYDTKELLNKALEVQLNYQGPMQSFVNVVINFGRRGFLGKEFDEKYVNFNVGFRPSGTLSFSLSTALGDRIDYANRRAGRRVSFHPMVQLKAGRRLLLNADHVYERLSIDQGRLYTANLTNLRVVYQFNRRVFLRTILQYADYDYNSPLYTFEIDPKFQHLFSQVLFSYKVNPRTVLFLGYSDDYLANSLVPDLRQKNRTFFLKIGYALVL